MPDSVLITGCSTGNGRATARAFLANGWDVYATARDPDDLDGLAAAGAETERLDVTVDDDCRRAVEWAVADAGGLDCLVNNAGYGQLGPVEDVPTAAVREQYEVNVFGPHRLVREALPYLRRGGGTVINLGSFNAQAPVAGTGVYSGSKAALTTTSQALRQEVAGQGVDVVVVDPAFVATEFYERVLAELDDLPQSARYDRLYRVLYRMRAIEGDGLGITTPEAVGKTVVRAAESGSPKNRYHVGSLALTARVFAAVVPESWRSSVLSLAVRAMASRPGRGLVERWARARPPRAEPPDSRREATGAARTAESGDGS